MIYYIYRINFLCGDEGRYYIGKHSARSWNDVDRYTGSGVFCKKYFEKYGFENTYTKDILNFAEDKDTLAEMENLYVGDLWKKDYLCMNLCPGGEGGKTYVITDEIRDKLSKSHIGIVFTEERKKKISESQRGKQLSETTKQKISKSLQGNIPYNKGKKLPKERVELMNKHFKGATWYKDPITGKRVWSKNNNMNYA